MTELEEVAQGIYEQDKEFWPLTREQIKALVWVYCQHETEQVRDGVVDALMAYNKPE